MSAKPQTVPQYIAQFPLPVQKKLKQMRELLRKTLPNAEEGLKWGMPSYSDKRMLVAFAGFKNHMGYFPTPSAVIHFEKQIASKYNFSRGTIQFPYEKPLPVGLITQIAKFRAKEVKQKDAHWRSPKK